jgi:peptidase E
MAERHIVAMGGGGFLHDGDMLLDDYVLGLSGADHPRVCYLGTAMGDEPGGIALFHRCFPPERAHATHLNLFWQDGRDIPAFLLAQDVIYVGGGNTANMLAIWRVHGVDKALRAAWDRGVVLAGWSAGALCWFEGGITDSFGPDLGPIKDGLKFLSGTFCPHYDSESLRRPRYEELIGSGALADGFAADDGVGLVFEGRNFSEAVASLPGQHAYRVERRRGNAVEETQIRARLLR